MQLQPLTRTADPFLIAERVNQIVPVINRQEQDQFVPMYAADTGTATAYAIAPVPGIGTYIVGQIFELVPTNANTSANPTLNVNSKGAGTITYPDGSALVPGDLAAAGSYLVRVASTTPTFHLLTRSTLPTLTAATTFLAADVTIVSANTFVSGPNTGLIGANGQTWLITAGGSVEIGGGGGRTTLRIYNGTADIKSGATSITAGGSGAVELSVVVALTGPTTFTLQAADNVGGSVSTLKATCTNGGINKATSITAVRLS